MALGDAGHYTVVWNDCGNFVAGNGWATGGRRTVKRHPACGGPSVITRRSGPPRLQWPGTVLRGGRSPEGHPCADGW
nr:glycoside hydrolase family 11 protein [Streptomyces sp. WAC 00631]